MTQSANKTRTLVECALMIALATVLSYIPIFEMPQGGSITLVSTLPILLVSWRHGLKWGLGTGFAHGLLQMFLGIKNVMYCTTIWSMIGCILLDYIIAYMCLGLAWGVAKPFGSRMAGVAVSTVVTGLMRYACSFLSGILIWSGYAPEGTPVWIYSLSYNGSYMIPEIILTAVVGVLAAKFLLPKLEKTATAAA